MTDPYHIIVQFRPCLSCRTEDPTAFKITDVPGSLMWRTERLCMGCQGEPRSTHRCSGCEVPLQRSRTITLGEHEWTLCKKCLKVMREVVEERQGDPLVDHVLDVRGRWVRDHQRAGHRTRAEWLGRFDGLERIATAVDDDCGWGSFRQQVI